MKATPLAERFWPKVDKGGPDDCWDWIAKRRISGYGVIQEAGRGSKALLAHRAAWILTNGPIPKGGGYHGIIVMHTCDNRLCCNPAHLRLGTQADNVRDMDKKGRRVSKPPRGEKHHNSKLTDSIVREIRSSNLSNAEWARRLGVTRQAIRSARRVGWKHV